MDATFRCADDLGQRAPQVRARYGLPGRFILAVGAGRPHKNLALLVDAFAQLDPALAPALIVAGEADRRFRDGVPERVAAHRFGERVLRPGAIDEADLPTLYALADVLAFPR